MGELIMTDHDSHGKSKSVIWGCTDLIKKVINDNRIDLQNHLTDVEAMLR